MYIIITNKFFEKKLFFAQIKRLVIKIAYLKGRKLKTKIIIKYLI